MKEERVGGRNAQHYKYVEGTTMPVKVKSQVRFFFYSGICPNRSHNAVIWSCLRMSRSFVPRRTPFASQSYVSALAAFVGCRILPFLPTQAMASRGARQRLKGSGGSAGDTASAADKLRELLCSREAGGAEPRTE